MVNSFTPPNWHEDVPDPALQHLIGSMGDRNPQAAANIASGLLTSDSMRQGAYHDFMNQVNQQQMANLQNNRMEIGQQGLSKLLDAAPKTPQAFNMANQMGLLPMSPDLLQQGTQDAYSAFNNTNLKEGGQGIGAMATAGVTPSSSYLNAVLPHPGGMSPDVSITDPAVVKAQREANVGRVAAAQATANKIPPDKVVAVGGSVTKPITTTHYMPSGTAAPPPTTTGTPRSIPASTAPTPQQKQAALVQLRDIDKDSYNDVAANLGPDGQPHIGIAPNGVVGMKGKSGKVY